MTLALPNIRLGLVYFAAIAVALPIAIISTAKLLLLLGALGVLANGLFRRSAGPVRLSGATPPMILLALAAMAASSAWSTGSTDEALSAVVKHGKLILIPAFLCLVRTRREALNALACFVGAQVFLVASTWLLALGLSLPWAKNPAITGSYAIFSSYLDQSIMTAVLAAMCWHLKTCTPLRHRALFAKLALVICALALACVFFVFQGRTGHVVAIALISLTLLWELPRRYRFGGMAIPVALVALLAIGTGKGPHGLMEIGNGIEIFNHSGDVSTSSSSIRLNLWHRSLQSIAENPGWGTGAGSWGRELNRQEALHAPATFVRTAANPHQEYLLWGIELGVPGVLLLCGVLAALYRDSLLLDQPGRRAMQSVLAALALACLFNCALYDALIGDFFCVALSLTLALGGRVASPARGAPVPTGA